MSKVIVHIDLNAFFARCEEIKDPSLENKPVAVGHEGRAGIVSTCSYKAREYGVHSAMPMSQAKKLCPHLIIKPDDFRFYHVKSKEFIEYIRSYTKLVEVASCDECYADFTEAVKGIKNPYSFFEHLRDELFRKTQLKCSIGVGPTKFLAKMASDYKKPMGITIIHKRDIAKILYPLPIKDMFGVGKQSVPRLQSIGVNTIGDLAKRLAVNDPIIDQNLSKFSLTLKEWLEGKGDDTINLEPWDPKSVSCSSTLEEDTNNDELIKLKFSEVAHELVYRLKRENKIGNTIQIMVKDTEYKAHNQSITFETPTDDYQIIFDLSLKLYEKKFAGLILRAVGISLQNLISKKDMAIQMTLFDYQKHEEESTTKLLINDLNRQFDKPLLSRASEVKKNGNHRRN